MEKPRCNPLAMEQGGVRGGVMKEVKMTNKMMKDRCVMNYDERGKRKNEYEKEKRWNRKVFG